ncbi:UNVERIFIED_CONTAM: hypothetical protein FKN15_044145 [Acipenser sinensis]
MENICGYLMKYTNLVTGWQYRFFVLNNEAGMLEYFVNEQSRAQKPRGTLPLAGAVISPSDEDSHTFTVNAISGEQYKLRGTDAKERQHWVSRLQICTQHHTEALGKINPPLKSRSFSMASQSSGSPLLQRRASQNAASFFNVLQHKGSSSSSRRALQPDHLMAVRETIFSEVLDEDSHTFTVNAISGEQYKLRGTDAKERQHWVSRLQICTQHHTEALGKINPPLKSRSFSMASQSSGSPLLQRRASQNAASFFNVLQHKGSSSSSRRALQPDHLMAVREMMTQAEGQHRDLIQTIESLPASGGLAPLDRDLLLLKATSTATMNCLNDCFHILQLQQAAQQKCPIPGAVRYVMMTQAEGQHRDLIQTIESLPASGGLAPLDRDLLLLKATSTATMNCLNDCFHILQLQQAAQQKCPIPGAVRYVMMTQAEGQHRDLIQTIESLPASGGLAPLDRDLLLLKATSTATMNCLNDCFHILQLQQAAQQKCPIPGATIEWLEPKLPLSDPLKNGNTLQSFSTRESSKLPDNCMVQISPESCHLSAEHEDIDPEDEVMDSFVEKEDELGPIEEERSIILHLLSQLKLGMDLTRVVLPTFILEKRSLLEMYADFMSHPDLFVAITDGANPEDRMIRFVEYYLTSFHEGRKGAIAKKPYNPIIGETFHCSWRVPSHKGSSLSSQGSLNKVGLEGGKESSDSYHVRFVAEQVSHHPPVSGFYAECAERRMCVNTHVWTKSKFMGMSIGVSMIGEGLLCLQEHDEEYTFTLPCAYARSILTVPWVELGGKEHDEEYTFTLPCAYARSILTVPWVELGGKVNVNCAKTGYSAAITFQTKPFYGGKLHKVTAEVKHNPTNTVSCRVQGEWNGVLEFSYSNGETKVVDVTKLPVTKKRVRPNEKQGSYESRRLWQHVTQSLREGDIEKATEHKRLLEERQRAEERHRTETGAAWCTRYFQSEPAESALLWNTLCQAFSAEREANPRQPASSESLQCFPTRAGRRA